MGTTISQGARSSKLSDERRCRRADERQGTVTVEFAFMAPIIFLVFIGTIELGHINFVRNMANDAAYQVARKAIVPGSDIDAAEAEALSLMRAAAGIKVATITTTQTVDTVDVVVTIPISQNSWGAGRFVGGLTVEESCMLAKQIKSEVP